MRRQRVEFRTLWLGACLAVGMNAVAWAAEPSPRPQLPDGALISAQVQGLGGLIDRIESSELRAAVLQSPEYQKWSTSPDGNRFRGGLAIVESQLGMDIWTAARRLLGGQIVVGLYPPSKSEKPDAVLVVEVADDEFLPLLREKAQPWIELSGQKLRAADADGGWEYDLPDGAKGWMSGRTIAVATTAELLRGVQDRVKGRGVVQRREPPTATLAEVHAGLQQIRELSGQSRLLPARLDNPLGSMLLGGLIELIAVGQTAVLDIRLDADELAANLTLASPMAALNEAHRSFFTRAALEPSRWEVPRQLAAWTVRRDWAEWYRQRDQLLEAKLLPEFDKFESGLANILPGKDFAEDVLAHLAGPMTFVFAEQTYGHLSGKPGVQLPAMAVVLELKDPSRGSDVFQLFFQTITAIANLQAMQQGRQPWILSSETHEGVQVNYAKYLEQPKGDLLGIINNLQPAGAQVGRYYVSATSVELCRDLIDQLRTSPAADASPPAAGERPRQNFHFALNPAIAAQLLEANRDVLEARGVQEGKTAERSAAELQLLNRWLRTMQPWTVETQVTADGATVELRGSWK